ncbi:MAG: tRNA (N6-isopentenyl adenosine(37)-C2)-methylthiotransferase MiaB [Phycisphaerae bacterium]
MRSGTYLLETFGCQMNVLDSELVEVQLQNLGLRRAEGLRDADIVLFNTCSVRQHAEDKVLSRVGKLKKVKQQRPELIVGVLGCMAERRRETLFADFPHLDLICGPGELARLPELVAEVRGRREQVAALADPQQRRRGNDGEDDGLEGLDRARCQQAAGPVLQAYVRVQRGCDKFCTYCVVPFVRGPERCRPPEAILHEVRSLAARGCREVTLLGQTVDSYVHRGPERTVRFAELLEQVHAVEGLDRIRFVTSYPADFDEDIFRVMRDCPRIMPYLHIPAQSGSDRMLQAMCRGYTVDAYVRLLDTARHYLPHISLAGDFIVGFCGETEEDFQASIDLVRRAEYKSIFVFKYSPRPGTSAERVKDDDVPPAVKARRNNELLAVQEEISRRLRTGLIGQTVEVLVEGPSKTARKSQAADDATPLLAGDPGRQLVGRTPGDLIAVFDGEPEHVGAVVRVRVEDASPLTLFGSIESIVSAARTPN